MVFNNCNLYHNTFKQWALTINAGENIVAMDPFSVYSNSVLLRNSLVYYFVIVMKIKFGLKSLSILLTHIWLKIRRNYCLVIFTYFCLIIHQAKLHSYTSLTIKKTS